MNKNNPSAKDFLKDSWCINANKPELSPLHEEKRITAPPLTELRETEWSNEFEHLMRNRLVMGSFRYGRIKDQDYTRYNLPAEIKKRTDKYINTHNLEHLVDVANMCLLAYVHGKRNGEELKAIDDGEHTPEIKEEQKLLPLQNLIKDTLVNVFKIEHKKAEPKIVQVAIPKPELEELCYHIYTHTHYFTIKELEDMPCTKCYYLHNIGDMDAKYSYFYDCRLEALHNVRPSMEKCDGKINCKNKFSNKVYPSYEARSCNIDIIIDI